MPQMAPSLWLPLYITLHLFLMISLITISFYLSSLKFNPLLINKSKVSPVVLPW